MAWIRIPHSVYEVAFFHHILALFTVKVAPVRSPDRIKWSNEKYWIKWRLVHALFDDVLLPFSHLQKKWYSSLRLWKYRVWFGIYQAFKAKKDLYIETLYPHDGRNPVKQGIKLVNDECWLILWHSLFIRTLWVVVRESFIDRRLRMRNTRFLPCIACLNGTLRTWWEGYLHGPRNDKRPSLSVVLCVMLTGAIPGQATRGPELKYRTITSYELKLFWCPSLVDNLLSDIRL